MKNIILTPKRYSKIPVEAEVITPDNMAGKTLDTIKGFKVFVGNKILAMSELFDVDGESAETSSEQLITIDGDAAHVKYIGKGMTSGEISIRGNAGMHAGSMMAGGKLTILGDVDDWTGAEMKGGVLEVKGNAKDLLGSAYRGSSDGMTGGCIVVGGNAGAELGSFMRRGTIVIKGNTGSFTGLQLNGGTIISFGRLGKRAGALAKGNGGVIASFGGVEEILPTYIYEAAYAPTFMKLYLKDLSEKLGMKKANQFVNATLESYRGDRAIGGNAEILVGEKD